MRTSLTALILGCITACSPSAPPADEEIPAASYYSLECDPKLPPKDCSAQTQRGMLLADLPRKEADVDSGPLPEGIVGMFCQSVQYRERLTQVSAETWARTYEINGVSYLLATEGSFGRGKGLYSFLITGSYQGKDVVATYNRLTTFDYVENIFLENVIYNVGDMSFVVYDIAAVCEGDVCSESGRICVGTKNEYDAVFVGRKVPVPDDSQFVLKLVPGQNVPVGINGISTGVTFNGIRVGSDGRDDVQVKNCLYIHGAGWSNTGSCACFPILVECRKE